MPTADALIDVLTGLDGRSLVPYIDFGDPEEVDLLVELFRTVGNEPEPCCV